MTDPDFLARIKDRWTRDFSGDFDEGSARFWIRQARIDIQYLLNELNKKEQDSEKATPQS